MRSSLDEVEVWRAVLIWKRVCVGWWTSLRLNLLTKRLQSSLSCADTFGLPVVSSGSSVKLKSPPSMLYVREGSLCSVLIWFARSVFELASSLTLTTLMVSR